LRADYAQAYYNRAHTYALKQERERAIADYDQAISLQPLFSDAYVNRAVLHLMLRNFKAALSDLDTAIRINPKDVTALTN
ncbi:tetratricopeptide repeat protein, partial [Klebsiella pneumoniae]|nr:tetratricopeptide repeat protein [Klebsiella pneumoniae]